MKSTELADYAQKVYAGVLGKTIGVYAGKPIEGRSNADIEKNFGEIWYYIHERLNYPLVCPDDDLSGTFTFLRAIEDHQAGRDISSAQIGATWLNYLIENQTVLWWGGMGNSTEHTAWLRLMQGIAAPRSGSSQLNGQLVAEQIGAQIFIDGFAMVAPGDPQLAAHLAEQAARVSHDGQAVYAAQALAAMESAAFVQSNMDSLFDIGLSVIPADSLIATIYHDVRNWAAAHGQDWRATLGKIQATYGYDRYGGGCHVIPNHAVMVMAWAHAPNDFQKALMIANTAGWDTDCNAGNVGCLMGIKDGLAGIHGGPDWQEPFADRLILPTAEGTHAISDALLQTDLICRLGRQVMGWAPVASASSIRVASTASSSKANARFHFTQPSARHGFMPDKQLAGENRIRVENPNGQLLIRFDHLARHVPTRVSTPTFIQPDLLEYTGSAYALAATPTLYSGQQVRAQLTVVDGQDIQVGLYIRYYQPAEASHTPARTPVLLGYAQSAARLLPAGEQHEISWVIPDTQGWPIAQLGLYFQGTVGQGGSVAVDWIDWSGVPSVNFSGGVAAKVSRDGLLGWISSNDKLFARSYGQAPCIVSNHGVGLVHTGGHDWRDYRASARITTRLCDRVGLCIRYGGLYRYLAALYDHKAGQLQLVQQYDNAYRVLAVHQVQWSLNQPQDLQVAATDDQLMAYLNGQQCLSATIPVQPSGHSLRSGGIALLCDSGWATFDEISIAPLGAVFEPITAP